MRSITGPGTLALAVFAMLLAAASARADLRRLAPDGVHLTDVVNVAVIDRDLLAFDALGGTGPETRLRIGESVLWSGARGRVGVVLTDQRALGVRPGSGSWQGVEYRRFERLSGRVMLGERVALLLTDQRVIGFDGRSGNWTERDLGLREQILATRVGENSAVVVTNRRALGLSADSGGFFEADLRIRERIESVSALSNVATVTTSQRILVFSGPAGRWTARSRPLH